ncbi:hypothetical protein D3C79_657090 [compost metagenome]
MATRVKPHKQGRLRGFLPLHHRRKLGFELVNVIGDPQGVLAKLLADIGEVLIIVGVSNFPCEVARHPSNHQCCKNAGLKLLGDLSPVLSQRGEGFFEVFKQGWKRRKPCSSRPLDGVIEVLLKRVAVASRVLAWVVKLRLREITARIGPTHNLFQR